MQNAQVFNSSRASWATRAQVHGALGACLLLAGPAHAASAGKTIYQFPGQASGEHPVGKLFIDANGAIYGATDGGPVASGHPKLFGTVFKLVPPVKPSIRWTQTTLFSFQSQKKGAYPSGGVVMDANGAIYGMTASPKGPDDIVYKLTAPVNGGEWIEQKIYHYGFPFVGEPLWYGGSLLFADGSAIIALQPPSNGGTMWKPDELSAKEGFRYPFTSGLAVDKNGGFYVESSGNNEVPGYIWYAPAPANGGTQWSGVYSFQGGTTDGSLPAGGLTLGADGFLYGTTEQGGLYGGGTIFQVTPPPAGQIQLNETVLYNFGGNGDGTAPIGGVVQAADGTFYGTTSSGSAAANAGGSVFSFKPPAKQGGSWTYTTLYGWPAATGPNVPQNPQTVAIAPSGKLYGTTPTGGIAKCYGGTTCGTVFQVTP